MLVVHPYFFTFATQYHKISLPIIRLRYTSYYRIPPENSPGCLNLFHTGSYKKPEMRDFL